MKRIIICLTLCAGLLNGCSETQTVRSVAGLSGTYDLTIVGGYIFATSTDTNELRVLDLNRSPRDWVRAPNPLEPLSIPVLARPSNLTRDVTYELETRVVKKSGQPEQTTQHLHEGPGGPLVYARSAGSRQISVVSADPGIFREIQRLDLEDLGISGLVTAFAARGPVSRYTRTVEVNEQDEVTSDTRGGSELVPERGDSVLYFAVQEGLDAKLYRVVLSETGTLQQPLPLTPVELSLSGRTVTSLLVLPPPQDQLGQELLVVATRSTAGTGGETFRLDANDPQAPRTVYDFGGVVRLLATHPEVESTALAPETCELDATKPAKESLRAGEYLFGVLDESLCASQEQESCSGITAVETESGARAEDSTRRPMLPIRVGQALPTGMTLAPNVTVELLCNGNFGTQVRPLVGIVPTSDGRITLFDAAKLRPFDLEPEGAKVASNLIVDINGQSKVPAGDFANNHIDLDVLEGATRDESYRVLYEGALQGLARRPYEDETASCDVSSCSFFVEEKAVAPPGDEEPMVRQGDIVQLETAAGTCSTELSVTAVRTEPRPGGSGVRGVFVTEPLPGDCQEPVRFTVRAGPQYPMVVYSDSRGYLGRLPPGGTPGDQPFRIPGGYYFHPPNFTDDERYRNASAYLRVYNLEPLNLVRGDQLVVAAQSGFRPFTAGVETNSLVAGLGAYRLPGPVVHAKVGDTDFAYIAYPSADGILQVALSALRANVANSTGLVPFD